MSKRIVLIGANGAVGSAALLALSPHHEVIKASRSSVPKIDLEDPESVEALFQAVGNVEAVVCASGYVPFKALSELSREDYVEGFYRKTLSQLDLVRIATPYITDEGSITITTGVTARAAIPTGSVAAMASGALESWIITAAREMPRGIRLNAVSPTVLAAAPEFHDFFPGFPPASSEAVGNLYRRAVDNIETGLIYELN